MHPVAHPSARCFILFPTSGFFARASSLSLSLCLSLAHTFSAPGGEPLPEPLHVGHPLCSQRVKDVLRDVVLRLGGTEESGHRVSLPFHSKFWRQTDTQTEREELDRRDRILTRS